MVKKEFTKKLLKYFDQIYIISFDEQLRLLSRIVIKQYRHVLKFIIIITFSLTSPTVRYRPLFVCAKLHVLEPA